MSAVSSQFSFRPSPPWKIGARVLNIMDSIYAIAFGLGLRTLVDAASQNFKLTGSLIGLWEGVIMLHFLKKMPKSSDPYVAYGVRLFVDFLVTESVGRLVLVLIWTAFGMVLADVTPAIWDEVGLKRVWRRFRRDLYTIYDRIPTVAFFPPPRTVRFLPSREPSVISPSIVTSQDTPITIIPPSSSVPSEPLKRRVPGYYPGDYSDTDTDRGSIIRPRLSPRTEVDNALASDLDEDRQSSGVSSSDSTEMGDPPSFTQEDIPDMEEEQALVDIKEDIPDPTTPKQKPRYIPMPPTPSDSAARWDIHRDVVEDVLHGRPRPEILPDIPDSIEDGATSDGWEKIQRGELDEDKAPTPPAKDWPVGGHNVSIPIIPLPVTMGRNINMGSPNMNPFSIDYSALDTFSSRQVPITTTEQRRESVPPPYAADDYDDIYCDPPPSHDTKPATVAAAADDANVNEYIENNNDDANDDNDFANMASRQDGEFDINPGASSTNPTTSFDASREQADAVNEDVVKQVEEEAKLWGEGSVQKEVEKETEAERVQKEAERARKEERERREGEGVRMEGERTQLVEERIQRKEETVRLEKERVRLEETRVRLEEERARKEEERIRKKEEEERVQKEAERVRKEEERARKEEEQRQRTVKERIQKEADEKKKADERAERKKKEENDAALRKQRQEEEKKKYDEAERKRKDDEEKKRKDDEEKKRKDDEAKQKEKEDQEARDKAEKQRQEDATKQKEKERKEAEAEAQEKLDSGVKEGDSLPPEAEARQAELDEQKQGTIGDHETREHEDDSRTVQDEQSPETQQDEQGPSPTANAPNATTSPLGDSLEEESVQSEITVDPPQQAGERLERMMILRAQMVELEKRLDELGAGGSDEQSPEVKAVEKSLKKFRRQAERRYATGRNLAQHLQDEADVISLEGLTPEMAGEKLEEKLEELLAPTSRSISISLTKGGAKQKSIIVKFLTTYNLTKYTNENPKSNKKASIKIPKKAFAEWLIDYRALLAKRHAEEDNGGVFGGMQLHNLS